jgi:hypothetical protein
LWLGITSCLPQLIIKNPLTLLIHNIGQSKKHEQELRKHFMMRTPFLQIAVTIAALFVQTALAAPTGPALTHSAAAATSASAGIPRRLVPNRAFRASPQPQSFARNCQRMVRVHAAANSQSDPEEDDLFADMCGLGNRRPNRRNQDQQKPPTTRPRPAFGGNVPSLKRPMKSNRDLVGTDHQLDQQQPHEEHSPKRVDVDHQDERTNSFNEHTPQQETLRDLDSMPERGDPQNFVLYLVRFLELVSSNVPEDKPRLGIHQNINSELRPFLTLLFMFFG